MPKKKRTKKSKVAVVAKREGAKVRATMKSLVPPGNTSVTARRAARATCK
jgi:hypothetical protein